MSYENIGQAALDPALKCRITACVVQEQPALEPDPEGTADEIMWKCCAEPGWGEAWGSAVAVNNPDPGNDPGVITDGMILGAVQKWLPAPAVVAPVPPASITGVSPDEDSEILSSLLVALANLGLIVDDTTSGVKSAGPGG